MNDTRKKILILGRYISAFGGAHKYLLRLTQKLISSGADVCIGMNFIDANEPFRQQLERSGAAVEELPFDATDATICGRHIDKLINEYRPSILDCEAASKSVRYAIASSREFKNTSARKVFTMHLAIKSELANHTALERLLPFSSWNKSRREIRNFIGLFDDGISVSQSHALRIERQFGLASNFFTYIPNGVCPEDFVFPANRSNSPETMIGGCGGLIGQKRFDLLIQAMDVLVNKRMLEVKCRIAGDGVLRPDLAAQIRDLGLSNHVELIGHCSDIPKFLSELDIFVMCSDHEGFPYAQLEAMASGLASVVTDTGDLSLIVENGQQGFVTPIGDPEKLANSLAILVNDQSLRRAFSDAARQVIEQRYNAHIQEQLSVDKLLFVS